jgi:hypothetical protein
MGVRSSFSLAVLALVALILASATAEVFFEENFDGARPALRPGAVGLARIRLRSRTWPGAYPVGTSLRERGPCRCSQMYRHW